MIRTIRKKILKSRSDHDEETSMYQTEFLGDIAENQNLNSNISSSYDTITNSCNWDEERQRAIPAGDLHDSIIANSPTSARSSLYHQSTSRSSTMTNGVQYQELGSKPSFPSDDEQVFFESNSHLVSFSDTPEAYRSVVQNDNDLELDDDLEEDVDPSNPYTKGFCNNDRDKNDDDDQDDDDLSYDEEEDKFEFKDEMLNDLRTKESLFYKEKKNVMYKDRDHLGIIFQMHGSVWKHVFPFCLVNFCWCYVIDYLNDHDIAKMNIPSTGHSFMSILVAFLVVARVQITYGRFMEARGYLGGIFKSFRELMHTVAVLTDHSKNKAAKEWREKVAVQILVTLRVTVAGLQFTSNNVNPYDTIPEDCLPADMAKVREFLARQAHYKRTPIDEALRSPLVMASSLRKILLEPRKTNCLDFKLIIPEELQLLSYVSGFTQSIHGLNKLITTPFSFPLVQMSRTILFFWLFTLPMALMTDTAERMQISIIVFFVTYGFLGLEYVSIELDDPFGDDPNDFNNLAMAQAVYEDMYLILYQTDGVRYAEALRKKISRKSNEETRNNIAHDSSIKDMRFF